MRARGTLWLVPLLAGCSPLTFREESLGPDADPNRGEIRVEAPRRGRAKGQARDCVILLVGPDLKPLATVDSRGGPWAFENLEPGRYGLQISGRDIRTIGVDIHVEKGRRTTATFHAWRAAASSAPEDFALVTGKTLLYVVGGVFYVILRAADEALFGDDDEEEEDSVFPQAQGADSKSRPGSDSPRPRVRSLLKDP